MSQSIGMSYEVAQSVSRSMNERNDCAVVALTIVSDKPYAEVHTVLKSKGRRKRCGTQWPVIGAACYELELRLTEVTHQFSGKTIRALVPQLPKSGRFLVRISKHVLGVVNGIAQDWSNETGGMVRQVFAVDHPTDAPSAFVVPVSPAPNRFNGVIKASEVVQYHGEKELNLFRAERGRPPRTSAEWLALRAKVMAACEVRIPPIKRTTASVELGKWQTDIGYDMTTIRDKEKLIRDRMNDRNLR